MSENVQFDGEQQEVLNSLRRMGTSRSVLGQPQVPAMSTWLMKIGVKSESTAKYVLLSVSVICFVLAFSVYYFYVRTPSAGPVNSSVHGRVRTAQNQNTTSNQ